MESDRQPPQLDHLYVASASPPHHPATLDDGGAGSASEERTTGAKRASQACLLCRRRKLRCLGGWPCKRCTDSHSVCDFGQADGAGRARALDGTAKAYVRLEQLESSVADLLATLSGGPDGARPAPPPTLGQRQSIAAAPAAPPARPAAWDAPGTSSVSLHSISPSFSADASAGVPRATPPPPGPGTVRFDADLGGLPQFYDPPQAMSLSESDMTYVPAVSPMPGPAGRKRPRSPRDEAHRQAKGQKAEDRLAVATDAGFAPPFKALAYQPSVWDNREASRRNSPDRTLPPSRDELSTRNAYERRWRKERDDPINAGIVDTITAEILLAFFMDHCHLFLPVVDVTEDNLFGAVRQSPFLFSATCAIAARFFNRYHARMPPGPAHTPLEPSTVTKLVNLAEFHLGQTLLRKRHNLSDVQAMLLLAAWCLRGEGGGPDAWVVSGHAVRVARRLGVHTVLAKATLAAETARPKTAEWEALEAVMPQWRMWLCWLSFDGLFSLGFGRPQSTHIEALDEEVFLRVCTSQPLPRPRSARSQALSGDMYIAGQVQLIKIGQDLKQWGERVGSGEQFAAEGKDEEAARKFDNLNRRLDEWCRLWVESGSPYALYLGTSTALSRLQGDHMRLCINSYALRYSPDEHPYIAQCVRMAFNAAVSTISAHSQSSLGDCALAFATDYITITVAQAALFLIRMTKSSPDLQSVILLDQGVIDHYLRTAIELLEAGDLSETKLATFLAWTIRDICRVAEIADCEDARVGRQQRSEADDVDPIDRSDRSVDDGLDEPLAAGPHMAWTPGHALPFDMPFAESAGFQPSFDIDSFLQLNAHDDLGYLLGLPGGGFSGASASTDMDGAFGLDYFAGAGGSGQP